jgi:hypothetical protein
MTRAHYSFRFLENAIVLENHYATTGRDAPSPGIKPSNLTGAQDKRDDHRSSSGALGGLMGLITTISSPANPRMCECCTFSKCHQSDTLSVSSC